MDKYFREQEFSRNYRKIFKLRCPSMCALEDFYRSVPPEEFDDLKASLLAILIDKRMGDKSKKYMCNYKIFWKM